ncbi:glycosyltransferase family 2 protein [Rahnella laticis]|uniref:glycosyltransferase family 2 protein n=1 Tax=Rahnella laticis TaxID=2787622 RepID=UPI0018A319B6|nr:glycosyltransferase family 2 protein [Rahnella laticis]MBF7993294.1 glycosyltransferase family 2 protein [Rahnella laticis]
MNNIKLAVVIVSYNPVWSELKLLVEKLISHRNVNVYIVDNNSVNASIEFSKFNLSDMVHFSLLPDNLGIAAAQNHGLKLAVESSNYPDFIYLFDQDSEIEHDFIDRMLYAYDSLNDPSIAAIGPVFSDSRYGFYYPIIQMNECGIRTKVNPEKANLPFKASMLIASGMMINSKCLRKIGYMDEALFIDYVDTEWCLRGCSLGYTFYAIPDVKMKHAIGDDNIKFLKWRIPVHSPFRRYYRIRNSFYLLKLPHVPKIMAIREIVFSMVHQTILILSRKDTKNHIKSFIRGVSDGLRFLRTYK